MTLNMTILKREYKIITVEHWGTTAYWVEQTKYLFGHKLWVELIGDYELDDSFGELGDCPFFIYTAAEERIKKLKK